MHWDACNDLPAVLGQWHSPGIVLLLCYRLGLLMGLRPLWDNESLYVGLSASQLHWCIKLVVTVCWMQLMLVAICAWMCALKAHFASGYVLQAVGRGPMGQDF